MDNKRLDLASIEEIDQELRQITSTDFEGFARGKRYEAALLLAEMHKRFDTVAEKQNLLGFSSFTKWVEDFCAAPRRVSPRAVWYYVKAGRFLLPHNITEAEFETLTFKKRTILVDLAEAGRLTRQLLTDLLDISENELKKKSDPLLGREIPWEERLEVDSHEAAMAALIQLGRLLDYKTYTAYRGTQFQGKKLGEIATLTDLPRFLAKERAAKRIDVIWLNLNDSPESFFEVEHSTRVKPGLHRMYQVLLTFNAKFFVVAKPRVRPLFLRAISESPYNRCRDKYLFRSYPQLEKMFHAALKYRKERDAFFAE
jgi:hypothetical protein